MTPLRILIVSDVLIYILFIFEFAKSVEIRIFGGVQSSNPIPYQVSLQRGRSQKWSHFCGGSIISLRFVLTAAHCVFGENVERLSVLAGTTKRSSNSTRYQVDSYTIHPNYTPNNYHDIALIKTTTQFDFNLNVAPINYDSAYYVPGGLRCSVSGWGVMERIRSAPFPEDLQNADLWTIPNYACRHIYNLTSNAICAVGLMDEGTCAGDSGGPLVNWDKSLLIGIVSHGSAYCGTGIPDVYTRVSVFSRWIKNFTQSNK